MASTPGPKELALKAQREARAGGVAVKDRPKAVVQKTRTASPSAKADPGGAKVPPKPPAAIAASGEGPFLPVTVSLDQPLIDRLDEWAHGKRLTRSAAAREVLARGMK